MIRKLLSILLLLLIPFTILSAVDAEDQDLEKEATLRISGYKIGTDDYAEIVITDAITESLNVISNNGEIDITNHVYDLIGSISESDSSSANVATNSSNFRSDQVVFSYRVAGNSLGNYTLTLTLGDLKHVSANSTIETEYDLGNLSYSFLDVSSEEITEGDSTYSIGINGTNDKFSVPSLNGNSFIISNWKVVLNDTDSSGPCPVWIHRGAIAMTISSSYLGSTLPTGDYKAKVEVKLEII